MRQAISVRFGSYPNPITSFQNFVYRASAQGQSYRKYLQPITSSSGIYFDYLGSVKISNGYLKILIPLNISHFGPHIQNIRAALDTTKYLCNQTRIIEIDSICKNRLQPLTVRYQDLETEFDSISHLIENRMKRAWIGGVGSVLKQIFGTLDENDAIRYNDAIESVQDNEKQLVSLMKENILVTSSSITSYNKTFNKIKDNEINLNQAIDNLSSNLKNISEQTNGLHILFKVNQIFNSLETSILTLSFQLEDVINAILFSGQNILHPAIMTSSQLYRELANNYRHLSRELQLPIALDMNSIHYILSISTLVCYYINFKIMFVLQVPLVGIKEYTLFHNIALPTPYSSKEPNKFSLIIPSNKYIAMTKDRLHYCTFDDLKECKVVSPGNFICDVTNVYAADAIPTCESELLSKVIKEIPRQCDTRFVYGKLDIWKPIMNNKWIFVQSVPNKITIDCLKSKLYETTIFGTGILTLPNNCVGRCRSTTIIPKYILNITSPVNNIPNFNLINDSCCNIVRFNDLIEDVSPIKLQNIDLDELKSNKIALNSLLDNLKKIDNSPHIVRYGTHYSGLIILILCLIFLYFCYLAFKCFCKPGDNRTYQLPFHSTPTRAIDTDTRDSDIELSQDAPVRTQI